MRRIIISALVLVMMIVSIGGCFVPWYEDGRGGGHGGHDRGGGPGGHDRDGGDDGRH